jgi:hypothetical protein
MSRTQRIRVSLVSTIIALATAALSAGAVLAGGGNGPFPK